MLAESFQDPNKQIRKNIPLSKFYRGPINKKFFHSASEYLKKTKSWFPKAIEPFILYTIVASEISTNSLISKLDSEKYFVQKPISTSSGWICKSKSAPYLIIVSAILGAKDEDKPPALVLQDAFAMPIFSTGMIMPLESNFERTVFKTLLDIVKKYSNIIIEKPLFDYIDEQTNQKYRPDFILYIKNKHDEEFKIFIEVLGSANQEYLSHKKHISNISKKYCRAYISVKAYDWQNEYTFFTLHLTQILNKIFNS